MGGRLPVGYYKDAEKTAKTFVTIDGQRYSVPGDFATVAADGALQLLGRGSVVINTGGEKVYPEEVEEILKTHPAVADAACVGVADERFGEAICAIVQIRPGMTATSDELVAHVKGHLAGFKAPRHVVIVDSVQRTPAGKLDYRALQVPCRRAGRRRRLISPPARSGPVGTVAARPGRSRRSRRRSTHPRRPSSPR